MSIHTKLLSSIIIWSSKFDFKQKGNYFPKTR